MFGGWALSRVFTWLRPGAEVRQAPPDEPALEVPGPPNVPAFLDALDIDAAPLPPARTDLRALDADLARARRQRKRALRRPPARRDDGPNQTGGVP